jgi:predicted esterase YcpF (UPF0227 family)
MKIIYFHGFASTGNGAKADALRERFGSARVLSPDLPIDPREVCAMIDPIIRCATSDPAILVGTSLGGFYASYFSQRWRLPCVLVNPSTVPSATIGSRPGTYKNFATGVELEVRPEFAPIWASMEADIKANLDPALVSLFLAEDDDVLPLAEALRRLAGAAFKLVTPDGGHRYSDHWDKVVDRIAALMRPDPPSQRT